MTDTSATPSEAFLPVDMEPHDGALGNARQRVCANTARGKRPTLAGWQSMTVNQQTFDGLGQPQGQHRNANGIHARV